MSNISFTSVKHYQLGGIPVFLCETNDEIPDFIRLTSDTRADIFEAMTKIYCMGTKTGILQYDSKPSASKLMSYYHNSSGAYMLGYYDNGNIIDLESAFNTQSTSYYDTVWAAICVVIKKNNTYYYATNNKYNILKKTYSQSDTIYWTVASAPSSDSLGTASFETFKGGVNFQFFAASTSVNNDFGRWLENKTPIDSDDPFDSGGSSVPNGGGGDGNIGGDTNPDDGLPTISALDSGLLTAYNPTVGELQSLGKFLWSDNFNLDSFKKLFNDPFDTLLGLSIVPINPNTSGSKNIMFGNMDSGVSAPVVSSQWVTKDMGSVTLNEVWKGALDYSPSTSASIYLPFIGMRQLNINDVMGSTLHLIYKFDVLTGGCVAQIYVNHNHLGNKDSGFSWNPNQGLLYEFMGQCAVNIPLASQDFTNTIRSAVSAVGMVAGTSASIATGNPVLGLATATMASANLGMQANTPTVERSGHLSGSCSLLGYYQPFLVVTRPHQCKPSRYYALRGVPSQVYTSKLSKCTGFTQITANNNIHVVGAEDSELAEIQNLLVSGVYFPDKKR